MAIESANWLTKIELTTFYDFKKIRSICNAEQQKKFDEIIGEAFRMMGPRPPRQ